MLRCDKCGTTSGEILPTVYGELRCERCYDDYLMTDRGKVEYLIGIVTGALSIDDYDADFLGYVAVCWNRYRDELPLSNKDIAEIEILAAYLGLL